MLMRNKDTEGGKGERDNKGGRLNKEWVRLGVVRRGGVQSGSHSVHSSQCVRRNHIECTCVRVWVYSDLVS